MPKPLDSDSMRFVTGLLKMRAAAVAVAIDTNNTVLYRAAIRGDDFSIIFTLLSIQQSNSEALSALENRLSQDRSNEAIEQGRRELATLSQELAKFNELIRVIQDYNLDTKVPSSPSYYQMDSEALMNLLKEGGSV